VLRIIRRSVVSLLVLYLALWGFTKVIHYPDPIATIRLGLAPASKTPDLLPSHTIKAGVQLSDWKLGKAEVPGDVEYMGKDISFQTFLDTTHTNAFLIVRNGKITYEYYKDKKFAAMRLPSYSVAKTMTSLVAGQLIDQGKSVNQIPLLSTSPNIKLVEVSTKLISSNFLICNLELESLITTQQVQLVGE